MKTTSGRVWHLLLSKPKSWIITIGIATLFFLFNVVIKNYRALYELATITSFSASLSFLSTLTFGYHNTVTLSSYLALIIISLMIGLVAALIAFKTAALHSKATLSSSVGLLVGIIAPGCAACGVGLAALFGISGAALAALPLKGLEFSLLAIFLLGLAIYNLTQGLRVCEVCKITFNKTAERRSKKNGNKN